MFLKVKDMIRKVAAVAFLVGLQGTADSALVFEYDAATDAVSPWAPNVNTSSATRDWTLSGHAYNAVAGSSYPGIASSYSFSGSGSGGSTTTFSNTLDGSSAAPGNAAGASSAWELWVKPNRSTLDGIGNEVLIETGGADNGLAIVFKADSGGVTLTGHVRASNGSSGGADIHATTKSVSASAFLGDDALLDDFMQIVLSIDPAAATDKLRLYVNGQSVDASDGWASWQIGGNGAGLARINGTLAGNQGGGAGFSPGMNLAFSAFAGDVALLRIYEEPLDDSEVSAAYLSVVGSVIPEPQSILLAACGLLGLVGIGTRKRRRK